jgi:hypothetical protein
MKQYVASIVWAKSKLPLLQKIRRNFEMAKSKLVAANEKIAENVVSGYKKIEDGVVGGYKKIENGVVNVFQKISDGFVDQFLTHEGKK